MKKELTIKFVFNEDEESETGNCEVDAEFVDIPDEDIGHYSAIACKSLMRMLANNCPQGFEWAMEDLVDGAMALKYQKEGL